MVLPATGKNFDPTEIPEAVRRTGFDPRDLRLVVVGTLRREDDLLVLELEGPLPELVLAGGEAIGELMEKPQLLGSELRIKGKLHGSHGDRPPGLTVESWEAASGAEAPTEDRPPAHEAAAPGA